MRNPSGAAKGEKNRKEPAMIISDALKAVREYWDSTERTEDDEFMFTEALGTLITETKNPKSSKKRAS